MYIYRILWFSRLLPIGKETFFSDQIEYLYFFYKQTQFRAPNCSQQAVTMQLVRVQNVGLLEKRNIRDLDLKKVVSFPKYTIVLELIITLRNIKSTGSG